jgi:ankyrin repeat protein
MISRLLVVTVSLLLFLTADGGNASEVAFAAAYWNDEKALASALKQGTSPDARNAVGETLLYVATGPKGGVEVVRLLLRSGANPNAGQGRYTPLMNAASWVNLEAVNALLEAGADPRIVNERGETAIQVVGRAGGRERAVIHRLQQAVARAETPGPSIEKASPSKPR